MYRLAMDSFSSLIASLGGPSAVAAKLKLPPGTVQKMKDRDSVDPRHWPDFLRLAREREIGITLETLARLSVKKRKQRAA